MQNIVLMILAKFVIFPNFRFLRFIFGILKFWDRKRQIQKNNFSPERKVHADILTRHMDKWMRFLVLKEICFWKLKTNLYFSNKHIPLTKCRRPVF
jgi:hypothetical protein